MLVKPEQKLGYADFRFLQLRAVLANACCGYGSICICYNSCFNRHYQKCQGHKREEWIQGREADLLPWTYTQMPLLQNGYTGNHTCVWKTWTTTTLFYGTTKCAWCISTGRECICLLKPKRLEHIVHRGCSPPQIKKQAPCLLIKPTPNTNNSITRRPPRFRSTSLSFLARWAKRKLSYWL